MLGRSAHSAGLTMPLSAHSAGLKTVLSSQPMMPLSELMWAVLRFLRSLVAAFFLICLRCCSRGAFLVFLEDSGCG
eukprot:2306199-Heterocapsa_arctica.AAC.1